MYFRHVSKYYEHANTFVIMVQLREGLWQGQGGISFQDFFNLKMLDFLKPYMIYFNNQNNKGRRRKWRCKRTEHGAA